MALAVADLLSWGKCSGCGDVIWTDNTGSGPQRAICSCGGFMLRDDVIESGSSDPAFGEAEMQAVLDEGIV